MLLTNSEIVNINQNAEFDSAIGYARAIESAVLAKLKAQDPIGVVKFVKHRKAPDVDWEVNVPITRGMALYEHPLPPDDVVQKYEKLLYAVHRKFPDETRHQTALRYIKTAESPSYTNAAMKEMK